MFLVGLDVVVPVKLEIPVLVWVPVVGGIHLGVLNLVWMDLYVFSLRRVHWVLIVIGHGEVDWDFGLDDWKVIGVVMVGLCVIVDVFRLGLLKDWEMFCLMHAVGL